MEMEFGERCGGEDGDNLCAVYCWGRCRQVQPSYVVTSSPWGSKRRMTLRRKLSDATAAYGAVTANARRPSIRTDLMTVKAKQTSSASSRLDVAAAGSDDSPYAVRRRRTKSGSETDVKRASKCNIQ